LHTEWYIYLLYTVLGSNALQVTRYCNEITILSNLLRNALHFLQCNEVK